MTEAQGEGGESSRPKLGKEKGHPAASALPSRPAGPPRYRLFIGWRGWGRGGRDGALWPCGRSGRPCMAMPPPWLARHPPPPLLRPRVRARRASARSRLPLFLLRAALFAAFFFPRFSLLPTLGVRIGGIFPQPGWLFGDRDPFCPLPVGTWLGPRSQPDSCWCPVTAAGAWGQTRDAGRVHLSLQLQTQIHPPQHPSEAAGGAAGFSLDPKNL